MSEKIDKTDTIPVIFPNPSEGDIHISVNNPTETQISVSIYNISGKMFLNRTYIISKEGNLLIEKSEAKLNPGIYFISITGENINTTNKLVVF